MLTVTIGGYSFKLSLVSSTQLPFPSVWYLFMVELFATCYSFIYLPSLIRAFNKTSLFHKNIVRITQALLISFYPSILARVVLFLNDVGLLKIEGTLNSVLIATACFIRLWCFNIMGFYMPSVFVERSFASRYINDYEKYPRKWIHRTILVFTYIISAILALGQVIGFVDVVILSISFIALFIIYCSTYTVLFRRDFVKVREMLRNVPRKNVLYSLSTKFQLKENLRVMKVLMQLSLMWAISAVGACLSFIIPQTVLVNCLLCEQICHALMDVCVAICLDIITALFAASLGLVRFRCWSPKGVKVGTVYASRTINEHRGASSLYFDQLTRMWKADLGKS